MNYKLELKQIVEFPRCRIYRDFIQTLITTKSIRTTGGSFLFYYLVLCSYANYRTSYRRMEHITYTIGPGEWICTVTDLQEWFRCRFQHQALSMRYWISWLTTSPIFPTAPITGNAGLRLKHSVPSFGDLLQKRHWIRSTSSFQSNTYRLSPRLFVIS